MYGYAKSAFISFKNVWNTENTPDWFFINQIQVHLKVIINNGNKIFKTNGSTNVASLCLWTIDNNYKRQISNYY